jgi:hypothetical protein
MKEPDVELPDRQVRDVAIEAYLFPHGRLFALGHITAFAPGRNARDVLPNDPSVRLFAPDVLFVGTCTW